MNTIILCTLIGIVLLCIEALVLLYREIKFLRALMAGIEQNLNNIWEHIYKLENDNWRAACMAEIKGNHELAVKIIKTKITNSTEEK